jgi:hypothetical protein
VSARSFLWLCAFTSVGCVQTPRVQFGVLNLFQVTETRYIYYVVGSHFGFRVDYTSARRPVILREEFHLPGPAHWNSSQKFISHAGGRIMIREVQLGGFTPPPPDVHTFYVEDLRISRSDPKGEYRLKLWLDSTPSKEFTFDIE